jgi:hypothetical protein
MRFSSIFGSSYDDNTKKDLALPPPESHPTKEDPPPYSAPRLEDRRFLIPFLPETKKPLTLLLHNNLMLQPGLRRQEFHGNPVCIGSIGSKVFNKCQHPPCVTGDINNNGIVILTIQDRDWRGATLYDSDKKLAKVMKEAAEWSEKDIMRTLYVNDTIWMKMIKGNPEEINTLPLSVREKAITVRDRYLSLFTKTVKVYVRNTIQAARKRELQDFWALAWPECGLAGHASSEGFKEVYKRCGFGDIAEMSCEEFGAVMDNTVNLCSRYRGLVAGMGA